MVLIASGDNENARTQLETSAQILESVRFEQRSPEARAALFELQTTCYHMLQKTLVAMDRNEEALVAAERCKSRQVLDSVSQSRKPLITCSDSIYDIVNRTKTNVIYFSLADDELFTWFLQPQKGIVRFNAATIDTSILPSSACDDTKQQQQQQQTVGDANAAADKDSAAANILEQFITMVRDSLGVNTEGAIQENETTWRSSENLLDDLANERAGFLRMVNRNHLMNSSNYSLSSLFSLGSVGGSVASLQGSTRYGFGFYCDFTKFYLFISYSVVLLLACVGPLAVSRVRHDRDEYQVCRHGRDRAAYMRSTTYYWRRSMIYCQPAQ